jgi:photosystem II stability/assembly factor-like uncharacterized protein
MSVASRLPWSLFVPAALILSLAFSQGTDDPPGAPSSSALSWTTLHRHGGEMRGIFGLGGVLTDIEQRGSTIIATGFDQSLRSTDGGATWQELTAQRAVDVAFAGRSVALVGGQDGEVSRSTDDGLTWTEVQTDADGAVNNIVASSDVIYGTGFGSLLRSADGGLTWRRTAAPPFAFNDLDAAGRIAIAVGGAGYLATTADGGETWQQRWLTAVDILNGVAFAGDRVAVIVGAGGIILRSTDAGASWNTVPSPTNVHLRAVAFSGPHEGLAVGFWGEALRTRDGGASWERERTGTRMHLRSVSPRPGGGYLVAGWRETILAAAVGGQP